jgi:putative cardiolipin synthase
MELLNQYSYVKDSEAIIMDIQQKYSASLAFPVAELTFRNRKNGYSRFIFISGIFLLLLVSGCAFKSGLKEKIVQLPESHAKPPATTGILAHLSNDITAKYGDEYSGFRILDKSLDGLKWRLALIDSAVSSIDVLTYLWYPDHSGRILLDRVIQASQRGVKVRLVVDDLLLEGLDHAIANLENQPNIEFRIFNPWKNRVDMGSRAGTDR